VARSDPPGKKTLGGSFQELGEHGRNLAENLRKELKRRKRRKPGDLIREEFGLPSKKRI
jgi:hypothetical protein